jgi:hypothetical protein
MKPRIIIKTVKNFHCPKIESEVHLEFCTDLRYEANMNNSPGERLIHPDCEEKDQCGIASEQDGKTIYDWSCCANPELKTAVWQDGEKREWGLG